MRTVRCSLLAAIFILVCLGLFGAIHSHFLHYIRLYIDTIILSIRSAFSLFPMACPFIYVCLFCNFFSFLLFQYTIYREVILICLYYMDLNKHRLIQNTMVDIVCNMYVFPHCTVSIYDCTVILYIPFVFYISLLF